MGRISEARRRNMAAIRSTNTRPEILLRKALFSRGLRYRLHSKKLPGKPDLVFSSHHAVVFINGCFWHHHDCSDFQWPKTRNRFWESKITQNEQRDRRNLVALKHMGWRVLVVWECSIKRDFEATIDLVESWVLSE